jgi:hypothetical protein
MISGDSGILDLSVPRSVLPDLAAPYCNLDQFKIVYVLLARTGVNKRGNGVHKALIE